MTPPSISTVVTTTVPWPEVKDVLDSVYQQTLAHGGEVILADGTGLALPPNHAFPAIRHVVHKDWNIFRLRSAGLAAARGAIVGLTEDHCRAAPDWIAAILRAHAEHPDTAVIGGGVLNGATDRLIDWANFLVSHGPYLPPASIRDGPDIAGQANVSYKREALEQYPQDAMDEGRFRRALIAAGGKLLTDDRIVVEHAQSLGILETFLMHFHDGRCVAAAFQDRAPPFSRFFAIAKALLWPIRVPVATARVVARAMRKAPYRRVALAGAPWMFCLMAFHKAGELAGCLAGPGNSPNRMR